MSFRERRLLKRIRSGDRSACNELIDGHYRNVYWYLLDLCGDEDKAADLTQDTFAKGWKAVRGFEGRSSFRTWLFSIARNEFLANLRRSGRSLETVDLPDLTVVPDSSPPVDEKFDALELSRMIREAVDGLPTLYREVVSLHYYNEMSIREVALMLSLPVGTVKSRLNRVLSMLKERLDAKEAGHENAKTEKIASIEG